MQVIWHDNIATYCHVAYRIRACGEFKERGIHGIGCQEFPALMRTKCDEEQGIVAVNASELRRKLWIIGHIVVACSRRPMDGARFAQRSGYSSALLVSRSLPVL